MEGTEVRKLAALEDAHWWYRERRHLLAAAMRGLTPGRALDVGAAGGGNTRVLRDLGWSAAALEYGEDGARGRRRARPAGAARRRHRCCRSPTPAWTSSWPSTSWSTSSTTTPRVERGPARRCVPAARSSWPCPATRGCGPPTTWPSTTSAATPGRRCRTCCGAAASRSRRWPRGTSCCAPWSRCAAGPAAAATSRTCTRWSTSGCAPSITAERYLPVRRLPGVTLLVTARRRRGWTVQRVVGHEVRRPALHQRVHPADVLAEHAQAQQLHGADGRHRHDGRGPAGDGAPAAAGRPARRRSRPNAARPPPRPNHVARRRGAVEKPVRLSTREPDHPGQRVLRAAGGPLLAAVAHRRRWGSPGPGRRSAAPGGARAGR